MKKFFFSMVIMMAAWMGANAMSFERAQAEALYLTDKMAYELNLNEQQYNDAYEINLDYFLRVDSPSDVYGSYYSYRLNDLRCILYDWQYSLLSAADYFLRPVVWRAGGWYFPVYSYYNRGYFYYSRPVVWRTYYGGHSRYYHHNGYYANRRPHWDGGFRGHDMHRPSAGMHNSYHGSHHSSPSVGGHGGGAPRPGGSGHSGGANPGGGHGNSGNPGGGVNPGGGHSGGSHGSAGRGNSFDGSSSRMGGSQGGGGYSGGSRGGGYNGGSRGGSPSMGGSRSGGGMSRGGSMGGSRGGGSSRGGRR